MTKDDWLKLAMPASITLLALAVFSAPLMTNAQLRVTGTQYTPLHVKHVNSCN